MSVMQLSSRVHDYSVHFSADTAFVAELEKVPNRFYVVDANVWRLYGDTALAPIARDRMMVMPAEENGKSLESVTKIWDALISQNAKKNMTLISIGGGIIEDVTGFAASTLYRGIRWIYVPTTLLAQADSCIGAKTSLNYLGSKNLIGTFYPPHQIWASTAFLPTLTDADFMSGMGEVIKLHLMGGEKTVQAAVAAMDRLRRREPAMVLEAIRTSLDVKVSFFTGDEFDTGRRNLLNLGHCFGHALEATSDWAIPHGQAVLWGIWVANSVAVSRGLLTAKAAQFIDQQLLDPCFQVRPVREHLQLDPILEAMRRDKKRTGQGLPLVMLTEGYGTTRVDDLTEPELAAAVTALSQRLRL